MTGELQNIRHSIVPPTETIHQLHFKPSEYLDNTNVGFLTENRPPVAEMSRRWNFEGWFWDSLEYFVGIGMALIGGLLLFGFLMWVRL